MGAYGKITPWQVWIEDTSSTASGPPSPKGKARSVGRVQQMLYADAEGVAVFVSRKKARVGE